MKNVFVTVLFLCFLPLTFTAQPWIRFLPDDPEQITDFNIHKMAFQEWLASEDDPSIKAIKQFRRMEFFMNGRMDENGSFPAHHYWNESNRVIRERAQRDTRYGSWSCLGPFYAPPILSGSRKGGIGRIDCISFHPANPDIIYIGAPSGGCWKTSDGGVTWEVLNDQFPTLGVSDIEIHPQHPDTIYLATGTRDVWWETYSAGVLKSYNGGIDWVETELSFNVQQKRFVYELLMDPANPDIMLAATNSGIYRTVNAGDDWSLVQPGNIKDLSFAPGDFSTVYATTFSYSGNVHVFRSLNSGESFEALTNLPFSSYDVNRITIGVTPANPDMVYLLCSDASNSGFYGLYRSDNRGDSWFHASAGNTLNLLGWSQYGNDTGGQGWFTLALAVDPTDANHVYVGGVNIWESFDGGASWEINAHWLGYAGADYVHADIHTIQYNYLNNKLYTSTDGSLCELLPGGTDWIDISDGIVIYQLYRLGLYQEDDNLAMVSPQDNGATLFDEEGYTEIVLAEGCDNFFDYTNPEIMYYGGVGTGLVRSMNGGTQYTKIHPPGVTKSLFNPPFIINPINPESIYSAFFDVYMSTNRGTDWTQISSGLTTQLPLQSLEIAPSDTNYLYTATALKIWRSRNYGQEWEDVSSGLPYGLGLSDICVAPDNPEHIWVTFQGFDADNKVFYSEDAGETWQNITLNLPNMPANCLVYENGSNNGIYLGTDIGVFYMDDDLDEWIDFNDGLPNVIIYELEINYLSGKLKAATYGRGFWETPLINPPVQTGEIAANPGTISVFPNPASDIVSIRISNVQSEKCMATIHDMMNKTVWSKNLSNISGETIIQVNLKHLARGPYILRINHSGKEYIRKILLK